MHMSKAVIQHPGGSHLASPALNNCEAVDVHEVVFLQCRPFWSSEWLRPIYVYQSRDGSIEVFWLARGSRRVLVMMV